MGIGQYDTLAWIFIMEQAGTQKLKSNEETGSLV